VRDADRFLALIEQSLGMVKHVPFQEHLPGHTWRLESSSGTTRPSSTEENATSGRPGWRRRVA